MDQTHITYRLGVALAIGLLIGLQREYAHGKELDEDDTAALFAGARSFALFAILGFLAAFLAHQLSSPLGFVVVVVAALALIVTSYAVSASKGSLGLTTEAAALVTLLIGSVCYWDELMLAGVLGVITATLLSLKVSTQTLVDRLTREDIYATLKFAFITLIILPLLPREGIGPAPFNVLVPFNIWLMVVFISGISFLGYVLIKAIGLRKGIGLAGLLGGLASSTAVTLSFSQRSKNLQTMANAFALAIMLSWTVMIVRVAIEVGAINWALLGVMWMPLTIVVLCCAGFCGYLYLGRSDGSEESPERFTNPFELRPALMFGLLYAVILFGSHLAQQYYGNAGVYASSVASGLVDVDAITLTMARLSQSGASLDLATAARAIMLAVVSNTLVKGGIVLVTGSASLRRAIIPGVVLIAVSAVASVFLLT